jgi:hypothetical protein
MKVLMTLVLARPPRKKRLLPMAQKKKQPSNKEQVTSNDHRIARSHMADEK